MPASPCTGTHILQLSAYQSVALMLPELQATVSQEESGSVGFVIQYVWLCCYYDGVRRRAYLVGAVKALKQQGYDVSCGMVGTVKGHPGADGAGISSSAAVGAPVPDPNSPQLASIALGFPCT